MTNPLRLALAQMLVEPGRKCIGCSLAVDADGEPAALGPCGAEAEALIVVAVQ